MKIKILFFTVLFLSSFLILPSSEANCDHRVWSRTWDFLLNYDYRNNVNLDDGSSDRREGRIRFQRLSDDQIYFSENNFEYTAWEGGDFVQREMKGTFDPDRCMLQLKVLSKTVMPFISKWTASGGEQLLTIDSLKTVETLQSDSEKNLNLKIQSISNLGGMTHLEILYCSDEQCLNGSLRKFETLDL